MLAAQDRPQRGLLGAGIEEGLEGGALVAGHQAASEEGLEGGPGRDLAAALQGAAADGIDLAEEAQIAVDASPFRREEIEEALAIEIEVGRDAEAKIGEDQGVEAVLVHGEQGDLHPGAAEHGGDGAVLPAVADVVQADVEAIACAGATPGELGDAAPGHVVRVEEGHLEASPGEVGPGGETAHAAADDGDVDLLRGLVADAVLGPVGRQWMAHHGLPFASPMTVTRILRRWGRLRCSHR